MKHKAIISLNKDLGFFLPIEVKIALLQQGLNVEDFSKIPRHSPILVAIIEEFQERDDKFDTTLVSHLCVEEFEGNRYHIAKRSDGTEMLITPDNMTRIE